MLLAFSGSACEKEVNPSSDCWNPHSDEVDEGLRRFYSISEDLNEALFRNDKESTINLAKEYLNLAGAYKKNWNYGNAIHDANIALGIIALREENIKTSGEYLLMAGDSPGSPQLNSFGPDLALANALLQIGAKKPVVDYLNKISSFWESGKTTLLAVIEKIEQGKKQKLDKFRLLRDGS